MNCPKCNNIVPAGAKFCSKCGADVSTEKVRGANSSSAAEVKQRLTTGRVVKKIFQIIAVVFFLLALGGMSSSTASHPTEGWFGTIYDIFNITAVIAFIGMLTNAWQYRKSGPKNKQWFGWRWIIFLLVVSFVGLGTMIFSQALTVAREKVATTPDAWTVYTASETNFSARFPSEPIHDSKVQEAEAGTVKIDTYKQADHTASVLYAVNVSELPVSTDVSDPEAMLENTVALSAKNGAVLNSTQTTSNGYPAISYLIEFNHPTEISRIKGMNIIVGHRIYQLLTAYDKPEEGLLEYDKFVDSFKVY